MKITNAFVTTAFVFLSILLGGCDGGASQKLVEQQKTSTRLADENQNLTDENRRLKQRIVTLETENKQLANTPERRLSEINSFVEHGDEKGATEAIAAMKSSFPKSTEVAKAEILLSNLQTKLRDESEASERKERLGFKILSEVKNFEAAGLKVAVSPAQITGRWVSDSYGDTYHYRDSERGNRFVVAKLSITADNGIKDPSLPGFGVYEVKGKKLVLMSELNYEFVRWTDFGSYLGNEPDFRNDFAHTATIPFSVGTELSEERLNQPVFLIAARSNCHTRDYDRFKNPPVRYRGTCREIKQELSLDEASSKEYFILKIWNGGKL